LIEVKISWAKILDTIKINILCSVHLPVNLRTFRDFFSLARSGWFWRKLFYIARCQFHTAGFLEIQVPQITLLYISINSLLRFERSYCLCLHDYTFQKGSLYQSIFPSHITDKSEQQTCYIVRTSTNIYGTELLLFQPVLLLIRQATFTLSTTVEPKPLFNTVKFQTPLHIEDARFFFFLALEIQRNLTKLLNKHFVIFESPAIHF